MSSTARGGVREVSDYYATPQGAIVTFLDSFLKTPEGAQFMQPYPQEKLLRTDLKILDPCAGGNSEPKVYEGKVKGRSFMYDTKMAYPTVLKQFGAVDIVTNDIREDSPATYHKDFTQMPEMEGKYDLVISNPPFAFAEQFILNSLKVVRGGGRRYHAFAFELFWKSEAEGILEQKYAYIYFRSSRAYGLHSRRGDGLNRVYARGLGKGQ